MSEELKCDDSLMKIRIASIVSSTTEYNVPRVGVYEYVKAGFHVQNATHIAHDYVRTSTITA